MKLFNSINKNQIGTGSHVLFPIIIVALITLVGVRIALYSNAAAPTKIACINTVTGSKVLSLQNGNYHLQGDEWDSTKAFSLCNNGNIDFRVSSSSIAQPSTIPGAYPSLYKGCHWGNCSKESGLPVIVSNLTAQPNFVTTSYNTSIVTGKWDDSYDIWFNSARTTSNNQSGLEMMIWLNHQGGVQPIGKIVATTVIEGIKYNVWHGGSGAGTVSYEMVTPTTSVSNLQLGPFAQDAINRGYMKKTWFLIDVEAGFEIWTGGTGLTVNNYNVTVL